MSLGKNQQRRKLLGVGLLAPAFWAKPVVDSVLLPAHAQTSAPPEDDDGGGGNGSNCDYKVYTGCEFGVIELCNHGGVDCNVESIKFELFYTDDPTGTPGGAAIRSKTFGPLSNGQCKTFENLWDSSDVGAWQGVFTFSPSGRTLRSEICRQEGGDNGECSDERTKSSLSFDEYTLCNTGDGPEYCETRYEIYYAAKGNPKNGSVVASGTVGPLGDSGCHDFTSQLQSLCSSRDGGALMVKAYQHPGHPGTGVTWSDAYDC